MPKRPTIPFLAPSGVRPDLACLSRREHREIKRYCRGQLLGDWRTWALTAAIAVPAVALSALAGTLFRSGGMAVGMAGGAAAGLLMSGVISYVLDRLARPHLAAELRRRGLCPRCAYDLRATPGTCPECAFGVNGA